VDADVERAGVVLVRAAAEQRGAAEQPLHRTVTQY
jgi:hypothetical protein